MIKNGNCKSYTQWIEYNKLNEFTISYNFKPVRHAKASNNFTTKEEIKFLPIPINPGAIISITINSVYPGTRKKDKTAISELIPIIEYY
jgi:hypothetical protein